MELAFESQELRTTCENASHASRVFGQAVADMLTHRLADLVAAQSVRELPFGNPRTIGDLKSCMVVDLCDGYTLRFGPNHPKNPTKDGTLDWTKVSRIKILRIERHDV